jgi:mRNA interferase RelE/StbE
MKIDVRKSFEKDVSLITEKKLAKQLKNVISELEACKTLSEIKNIKKLTGKGNYYRLRIGQYRLGFKLDSDTIILLRIMARKEIYKYFP